MRWLLFALLTVALLSIGAPTSALTIFAQAFPDGSMQLNRELERQVDRDRKFTDLSPLFAQARQAKPVEQDSFTNEELNLLELERLADIVARDLSKNNS